MRVSIANDYAERVDGRHEASGPHSGERLRREVLAPALARAIARGATLCVCLEGLRGCTPAFLDEAFGGLVRDPEVDVERMDMTLALHGEGAEAASLVEEALKAMRAGARKRLAAA